MESVFIYLFVLFFVVANTTSLRLQTHLQCPIIRIPLNIAENIDITDYSSFYCLNERVFNSSISIDIWSELITSSIPLSIPFTCNFQQNRKNATTILDSRYYCLVDEKEAALHEATQKCLISRTKKDISDPFIFFSPFNPPVIQNTFKPLDVELEDNYFEVLRPITPLKGSTSSITERINIASSKAGAISIAKSKGMSGNNEVLSSNKYKYCITTCKSNKWFIFSLPEMSLIDAIATANYERFSSSVQKFVLYGSPVYPTTSWSFIGFFEAKDGSSLQVFPIYVPVWTKFIKFEWLSWYRQEAMCTMSEVRVYGSNMINTMLQTDFSKSDSRSAGLKDIIDEENKEELIIEEPEVVLPSTERSSSPVSPEFQPLYELYKRCEEEQGEMTFSIALLSNKTKQKIHALKERMMLIENQTAVLSSLSTTQEQLILKLEQSYLSLQLSIQEVSRQRMNSLWSYCLAILLIFIILRIFLHMKKDAVNRFQFLQLLQRVQEIDKELKGIKQQETKSQVEDERAPKKVKKKSKKSVK